MRKFWNSFNRLDANRTLALAAVLISLCGLFVSLQELAHPCERDEEREFR